MQTAMNTHQRLVPVQRKDQNSHIDTGADAFCQCKEWLKAEGFTIIKVEIGEHALPAIHIQTCGKCNLLKIHYNAANYKSKGDDCGRVDNWKVEIMGCRVEWVERGH